MSLMKLVNNSDTDKNTIHSYIETYESIFSQRKESAKNILEIGIGDFKELNGGSIELWYKYFTNARIYAVDKLDITRVLPHIQNNPRIQIYTGSDAYNTDFFESTFLSQNKQFDVLIDDGPHTLESMITFIKLYHKTLAPNGVMIIEDVQDIEWIQHLSEATPEHLKKHIKVYDLRPNKNRYDDILFTIDLSI